MVKELDKNSFQKEVVDSKELWVVDFWAEWCGPCKMIAPHIEEVASEYKNRIKVGKVNIDDYPQIATDFGVMSIPTLGIFQEGEMVDSIVGMVPVSYIEEKINSYLK